MNIQSGKGVRRNRSELFAQEEQSDSEENNVPPVTEVTPREEEQEQEHEQEQQDHRPMKKSRHNQYKSNRTEYEYALPEEQSKKSLLRNNKSTANTSWEVEQFNKASQLPLSNEDKIIENNADDYEFVFDETQFVNYDDPDILSGDEEQESLDLTSAFNNEIAELRKNLPVYNYRADFLTTLENNQVLIVVGETGSGKTTQLPQYLYEAGYSQNNLAIACTQPRRVAATSIAARVAYEMNVKLGHEVGYTIRFDDKSSKDTVIKYVTDGMLLREFLTDPQLSHYSAIMIDEAHERTISTEILLGLLKDIIVTRPQLKIIIASATINAEKFSQFFNNAPILNIPGRRFPVKIHYTKSPEANYIQAALTTIFQIHTTQPEGDILVFLTGQEEIETMEEALQDSIGKLGDQIEPMLVCSIYANMASEVQSKIFNKPPPGTRKVVLATNIAETSITIDGIKYVVDPGYVKQNKYNPATSMESLVVVPCSRASADQRAGRAGRVGPGKCFRLFTKWCFYNELDANPTPEILRTNLTSVILLLLSLGINDLLKFPFMDPPSKQSIIKSLELLYALGALNSKGKLTKTGQKMTEFPLDPILTKCILMSSKFGVTIQICCIIAMISESSNLFYRPKGKAELADARKAQLHHQLGDHFTLLNVWRTWKDYGYSKEWCRDCFINYKTLQRSKNVYDQLIRLCKKVGLIDSVQETRGDDEDRMIQKALLSGFFMNVCRLSRMGDGYVKLKGSTSGCFIHPSSALYKTKPKLVIYYELVLTSKEYMRCCSIVDDKLVREMAGHYYASKG
ncbi:Pre-mRNA-splicing factor ATP-dependent RNA helicase-like protein cdc28 [Spathaspora sp. JA1]|nr:Pre-mRNA-splicing factor ATP-dependent RNA helicase-like protein cdc28 [Spathaspora sp. JA1]